MGSEHYFGVSDKTKFFFSFSQQLNKIQNLNTDWKKIVGRKYINGNLFLFLDNFGICLLFRCTLYF